MVTNISSAFYPCVYIITNLFRKHMIKRLDDLAKTCVVINHFCQKESHHITKQFRLSNRSPSHKKTDEVNVQILLHEDDRLLVLFCYIFFC